MSGTKSPFFDKNDKIIAWINKLSHWEQFEKLQFVTFRLADSLPQVVLREIKSSRDCFIATHAQPWDDDTKIKFDRIVTRKMNHYLDMGYGSCILKDPALRKIVSDAIEFYDGNSYSLYGYVVMPNHVHAVVEMLGENMVSEVFHNLKDYTARVINRKIGKKGKMWNKTFDRLVRSEEHLKHCLNYILKNPMHLPPNEYTLGGPAFEWTGEYTC